MSVKEWRLTSKAHTHRKKRLVLNFLFRRNADIDHGIRKLEFSKKEKKWMHDALAISCSTDEQGQEEERFLLREAK